MLRTAILAFRSDGVKKILDTASVLDTYLITLYASLDCLHSLENNKKSIAAKKALFNLLFTQPLMVSKLGKLNFLCYPFENI